VDSTIPALMTVQSAGFILDLLERAEVPAWVAGGWGVDALDELPTRFEMIHQEFGVIDLHPIHGDTNGNPWLQLPNGPTGHPPLEISSGETGRPPD
jgi:hypothetical protein